MDLVVVSWNWECLHLYITIMCSPLIAESLNWICNIKFLLVLVDDFMTNLVQANFVGAVKYLYSYGRMLKDITKMAQSSPLYKSIN